MPEQTSLGIVNHETSNRKADYLYRISIKSLIRNKNGDVLVVKENGRTHWDLPGGGMDHGEDIRSVISRELKEEVGFEDDFTYHVIELDEPKKLTTRNIWQIRVILEVTPDSMQFSVGEDGDELAFINPEDFKDSESDAERLIYKYAKASSR